MKRRVIQRRVVVLLLLLVGGAIVNVAVAWWCALQSQKTPLAGTVQRPGDFKHPYNMLVIGTEYRGFGVQQYRVDGIYAGDVILFGQGNLLVRTNAGWPMHVLTGECVPNSALTSAISVPASFQRPSGLWRANDAFLPLAPLWPGFAINTIFYAAVLWLLFAVPFALRRRRRMQRGQCPACAYPVGASEVCTECGNTLARTCMGLPPPATPAQEENTT